MKLAIGYDRKKNPEKYNFKLMTLRQVQNLRSGDRVWFLAADNTARGITVNGQPKLWKTRPGDVRVPLKYGMYQLGYAEWKDGEHWSGETLLNPPKDFGWYP